MTEQSGFVPPQLPVDVDAPTGASPPRWDIACAVAAGGAVGGALRYLMGIAISTGPAGFPWATFVENVSGCLILGALLVFLVDVWRPLRYIRPFLATGVLGGYTTFSTYTEDIRSLVEAGQGPLALTYMFGSIALGVVAAVVGMNVARKAAGLPLWGREAPQ